MPGGEFPMAKAVPVQSRTDTEQNHDNAGPGRANAVTEQGSHMPTECDLTPHLARGHPTKAAHTGPERRASQRTQRAAATPTLATRTGDSESRARDGRGGQTLCLTWLRVFNRL